MRALILESMGQESLTLADIPKPSLTETDILVEIAYAGMNPVDWKIKSGLLKGAFPYEFPIILGWDLSGVIAAIGSKVTNFKIGDPVFAYDFKSPIKWGSYAQYAPVDANHAAIKPKNLSFAEAAAIPLSSLTAWQALEKAQLKPEETILILGGSGAVGSMAVEPPHE